MNLLCVEKSMYLVFVYCWLHTVVYETVKIDFVFVESRSHSRVALSENIHTNKEAVSPRFTSHSAYPHRDITRRNITVRSAAL